MKRILVAILLLLPGLFSIVSAKEKIMVFPFTYGGREGYGLNKTAENLMIDALVKMKQFDVVERASLDKILKEQKLGLTGVVQPDDAVQVGNLLGASYAVIGSVSEISFQRKYLQSGGAKAEGSVTAQIRIVSILKGSVIASESFKRSTGIFDILAGDTSAEDMLGGYLKQVFEGDVKEKLKRWFPLRGYVIGIDANKEFVTVDIGTDLAVERGQCFWLISVEETTHPKTKKKMRIETRTGKIQIDDIKGLDVSKARVIEGRDKIDVKMENLEIEREQ